MSNPLAAFRKYQKTLLLFAAVGAMLAFGVLPILSDWMGQSSRSRENIENAVVVSWDGGELRESQIHNQRVIRAQLQAFQQAVVQRTFQRGAQPRKIVVPDSVAEDSIVQSILLAQEAERLGIFVGDDAVLEHLTQQLANDTIERDELALILKQTTGGNMGQQQLFDALKMELAANQMQVLANGSAFTGGVTDTALTPGDSFDYFKRLYRRMEAEVVAIPVADFIDQVSDKPTNEEVAEIYAKYKNTLPSPIMPTPGFKEPLRVAFQWLKADFQNFLEREKEKLTEEEIQNYYEENKSSYRKISLPTADDLQDVPSFDDFDDFDADDEIDEIDENKTDADDSSAEDEATDDIDFDSSEPATETETDTDDSPETENEDLTPPSLSHQDEDDESDADTADLLDETADEVQEEDTENTEVVAEDTGAEESEETAKEESTAPGIASESEEIPDANKAIGDIEAAIAGETNEPETPSEPEIEYYPLEEVRDDIANILARPKATEAITAAVDAANGELKSYFDDYMYWDTTPEDERTDPQAPSPPDLNELANRLGLIAGDIPLITMLEAEKYDLGNAYDINYGTGQRLTFVMLGFSPNLTKYLPQIISSGTDIDSKFVFWKIDEKASYTPELSEARPAVVRYWKMKKAIDLAKQKGKEIIAEAKAAEQSLQGAFGEDDSVQVADTGEFTWMTFGATPTGQGAPRLGFVAGVEYAGDDFMRAASSLEPGGFTVTQNYPETTVYVVYMKAVTADQEDLKTLFLNEGLKLPLIQIARRENALMASDWYQALEEERQLKWARPPEQNFAR